MSEIEKFLEERDRILIDLDVDGFRDQLTSGGHPEAKDIDDKILVISLHKARYEATSISDNARHRSAIWLRTNGYGRIGGPLLPKGELPK